MADLIDRGELLKTLYEDCECMNSHFLAAVRLAPTINRWIPCSERMPDHDTMVIVCYYGSDCIFPMQGETVTEAIARQNKVPTVTMGFLGEDGWNGADMFPMMVQPTFWMPLPEPPEKEDGDG